MSRTKQNRDYWATELHYIAHAWPSDKTAFRGDESVFNEYINMQSDMCESDGFADLAFTMRGFREFVPHSKRLS
jgi:hypothetical protein